jgi:hypothetical protein
VHFARFDLHDQGDVRSSMLALERMAITLSLKQNIA